MTTMLETPKGLTEKLYWRRSGGQWHCFKRLDQGRGYISLCDTVLEDSALDLVLDFAIPEGAFEGDELPLLESFGELSETSSGKDAMPLGAGFVIAFVVLAAFLGCDIEHDVLAEIAPDFVVLDQVLAS